MKSLLCLSLATAAAGFCTPVFAQDPAPIPAYTFDMTGPAIDQAQIAPREKVVFRRCDEDDREVIRYIRNCR